MNKILLAIIIAIIIFSVFFAVYILGSKNENPLVIADNFESTSGANIGEWKPGADVPPDPNNPGQKVQWSIKRVENISQSPTHSVEFFIDGRQDDGTIWLTREIDVGARVGQLNFSFYVFSEQESFNTLAAVVGYIGPAEPKVESDFPVLGNPNQAAGWNKFNLTYNKNETTPQKVWVAFGVSVRWETYLTYNLDDVRIEIR